MYCVDFIENALFKRLVLFADTFAFFASWRALEGQKGQQWLLFKKTILVCRSSDDLRDGLDLLSPPHFSLHHVTSRTRPSHLSACNIEKLGMGLGTRLWKIANFSVNWPSQILARCLHEVAKLKGYLCIIYTCSGQIIVYWGTITRNLAILVKKVARSLGLWTLQLANDKRHSYIAVIWVKGNPMAQTVRL